MRRHSNILSMILMGQILIAVPEIGESGEVISGFRDYEFGTPLSKLSGTLNLSLDPTEEDMEWYNAAETIKVLGQDYKQSFGFQDGLLIQVNIHREFEGIETACEVEFDSAYAALQATYGNSDQLPERKNYSGISTIRSATFTGPDGSAVKLAAVFIQTCLVNVAYVSSPGGAGF